jgi:hypothetical protein
MALTDTSYGGYLAKVRGSESGGNPNAKNPRSSASGLYQFTKGTWEGLGYDWKDRFNTNLQNQAMSKLTSSNANYLKSKLGINPSDADLYGAHFLGPAGYSSIYRASSNTPLSNILSSGEISANPFLKGKTAGYLKNWLTNKMGQEVSQGAYNEYGVDTSLNLPMNTGDYQTAPDIASKEDLEAEQAKAELLEKQKEKDFISEVQARQDQDSERRYQQEQQIQQVQEGDLDPSYYQVPQVELPNYQAIQYEQAQLQTPQEQPQYRDGGGIPERYKNMGFTRVGQKKEGDGQKKWKVLAKKGDKYKVVQGGYRGMQDFSQHGSKKRQDNFWSRMGGKDSAKANDPFSPLYWHKRLGKWEDGGEFEPHMMYNPETNEGFMANKMEDHLQMKSMGYIHTDEMNKNNPSYKYGGEIEGRVKCSRCGWGWDKSDSSEEDMYNCHKCGGQSTGKDMMKNGGQTEDDRQMVNGIADILSQVDDSKNRAEIAKQMVKDFENQKVVFNYEKFMEMSKLQNGGQIITKFEDGGESSEFDNNSARDWWVKKTGKTWAEAKKLGYSDGTASSNIELLNRLKDKNFTIANNNKTSQRSDMKQFNGFSQEEQNSMQNIQPPVTRKTVKAPIAKAKKEIKEVDQISLFEKVMRGDFSPQGNERRLQNGVITDKRTNTSYIIENGNVKKAFPVLTGANPDMNINDKGVAYLETHPESKATPRGTYTMNPKDDIYGQPGFRLNPVAAFGEPAARAKDIAQHVTYDFEKRNPLYAQASNKRYASYGCINCRKPDINYMTDRFKKGDTTMVIDSKIKRDADFLAKKLFTRK